MSEWTGFDSLDLTDVEAQGGMRLPNGRYVTRCSEAKIEVVEGSKNRKLVATFEDEAGLGDIRVNFNIRHSSEKAQEIALKQLKQFLVEAKHPNPDRPGDIKSLEGLRVGIVVGTGKPWTDNNGNKRQNSEVKRFIEVEKIKAMQLGPDGTTAAPASGGTASGGSTSRDIDDDIPF